VAFVNIARLAVSNADATAASEPLLERTAFIDQGNDVLSSPATWAR
jgi:hypothetical protein